MLVFQIALNADPCGSQNILHTFQFSISHLDDISGTAPFYVSPQAEIFRA
jgi:hypothetical protein